MTGFPDRPFAWEGASACARGETDVAAMVQSEAMAPLHVHRFGTGEDVHYFGIHGWGGGWETFQPLEPFVPDDASLWSIDLPGYGGSPPLQEWNWEAMGAAVSAAIDAIEAPRLRMIGNCSGAAFGLLGAKARPDRFEHLLLLDPFAFFPWYFSLLVAPGVGRLFYATAFENPLGRWMTNHGLAEHRTEETHLTESFEQLDHDVVYAHLKILQQIPGYQHFEGFEMPITIAYGEKTFAAVRESVDIWLDLWPQARAVEVRGAAHLPIQEATAELAKIAFSPTTA